MTSGLKDSYDVLIVGGGNAALCAAITAAEAGAKVLLLEGAPKQYRGGNSRHTRNFRCMHDQPVSVLTDSYSEKEYLDDLLKVTKGKTDQALALQVIRGSQECLSWMEAHGVRFQPSLSGTLSLSRTNAFFLGGGKALVNAYYRLAEKLGVTVLYNAKVSHLTINPETHTVDSVEFVHNEQVQTISPKSIVVASGGFQANIDWLVQSWGARANNFLIRGTPFNKGEVLSDLLDQNINSVGDPTQCHAVAIDGRAPKFDGGIATRLDCIPYSIVVNKEAKRFYDEGEDVWPKRYAIWGRLVANQTDQVAYAIIDSKSLPLFMPSVFPPIKAQTLKELSTELGLDNSTFEETVNEFNQACRPGNFFPTELDGVATEGITPNKTNWARPIDTPPYYAYSLKTGITFTYLGLKVDSNAQVSGRDGVIKNLWAAGEIMAGSILGEGYLAGFGMSIGTVFGRVAGREAAKYANH